ncbi:molybdopterin-dependent oxidoreductase [Actinoplanes sp. TBRC 11911]|uniref:molybdopterin-dependent oxidoreductase n=1 Tax=Actinoplanes sp. TBRC 11911 TaxID=2729386 RepID=UPI00145E8A1F|nr:molybdopterin-dependent oxidoreductase [Actinoplanes sp. TBRC 11911]NMO52307.1 molybdopterin-dependent oxidoreductase [Actinoplanes sp. TBRC 11911]
MQVRALLRSRRAGRRVDLVLGLLLSLGALTGLAANTIGVNWWLDLIQLHAAVALAILLLAPWKYVVIRRGLRRPRRGRPMKALSLSLLGFVLITIGSGLLHSTGRVEFVGPLTLMQIHVGAAVGALLALTAHFVGHAVRPRSADVDRRALLRLTVLAAGAAVTTAAWDSWGATRRRFTGSVPKPALEVTSWFDDGVQRVDPAQWTLRVGKTKYDLAAVRALQHERFTATLDCTSGWYSTQQWDGIRLSSLLSHAGVALTGSRSVEISSTTGYARWFGLDTLDDVWLATAVGGAPLTYGHGFPARIVAPGRRGFWWVKWVASIEPAARPPWAQSPYPLG